MESDSNSVGTSSFPTSAVDITNDDEHQATDIDYFTSSDIKNFQCPICFRIPLPDYAYEDSVCGNIFCRDCIKACISHSDTCPMCRNKELESSKRKIKKKNIRIYTFMQSLEVKCPSNTLDDHEIKCPWAGLYKDLPSHIKQDCINTFVECPNKCRLKIKRDMVEAHTPLCDNRKQECPYCQSEVDLLELDKHIHHDCTDPSNNERIIKCEFSHFGCKKQGKINEMLMHESDITAHFILGAKLIGCLSKYNDEARKKMDPIVSKVQQIEKSISLFTKCKENHSLMKSPSVSKGCNICAHHVSNSVMMVCVKCSYYVCSKCYSNKGSARCLNNINHGLFNNIKLDEYRVAKCMKCRHSLNSDGMKCIVCNCYYCCECIYKLYKH